MNSNEGRKSWTFLKQILPHIVRFAIKFAIVSSRSRNSQGVCQPISLQNSYQKTAWKWKTGTGGASLVPLKPATESRRNSSNKTGCVLVHKKWRPQSLPSNNKYRSQSGLKMFMNNFPPMLKIHGMGLFDFYEFLSCVVFGEIGLSLL